MPYRTQLNWWCLPRATSMRGLPRHHPSLHATSRTCLLARLTLIPILLTLSWSLSSLTSMTLLRQVLIASLTNHKKKITFQAKPSAKMMSYNYWTLQSSLAVQGTCSKLNRVGPLTDETRLANWRARPQCQLPTRFKLPSFRRSAKLVIRKQARVTISQVEQTRLRSCLWITLALKTACRVKRTPLRITSFN